MSKCDIQPEFECQNRISNVRMRYSAPNSNVKIGLRMSKCVIRPEFESRNRISNVKTISEIFGTTLNFKIRF